MDATTFMGCPFSFAPNLKGGEQMLEEIKMKKHVVEKIEPLRVEVPPKPRKGFGLKVPKFTTWGQRQKFIMKHRHIGRKIMRKDGSFAAE